MKRSLKMEIAKAKKNGKGWTDYRPIEGHELLGASRCPVHNRPSVLVSYSTELPGRVVKCDKCSHPFYMDERGDCHVCGEGPHD